MIPQVHIKSSDIFTNDFAYNKIVENHDVRKCGFFKVISLFAIGILGPLSAIFSYRSWNHGYWLRYGYINRAVPIFLSLHLLA